MQIPYRASELFAPRIYINFKPYGSFSHGMLLPFKVRPHVQFMQMPYRASALFAANPRVLRQFQTFYGSFSCEIFVPFEMRPRV